MYLSCFSPVSKRSKLQKCVTSPIVKYKASNVLKSDSLVFSNETNKLFSCLMINTLYLVKCLQSFSHNFIMKIMHIS